jgi:hypothetical protein
MNMDIIVHIASRKTHVKKDIINVIQTQEVKFACQVTKAKTVESQHNWQIAIMTSRAQKTHVAMADRALPVIVVVEMDLWEYCVR